MDAEVQVRAGGTAGGAHITDQLAGFDWVTGLDDVVGHVHIHAGISVLMVDGNVVACGFVIGSHIHIAAAGCVNGCTLGSRQIHTLVVGPFVGGGMPAVAKGAADTAVFAGDQPKGTGGVGGRAVAGASAALRNGGGGGGGFKLEKVIWMISSSTCSSIGA